MTERLYMNPTPVGEVTVRAARTYPHVMPCTRNGVGGDIKIDAAWHVYVNHERSDYLVVRTWIGRTILDGHGEMVTCWHGGVSPGDLARLCANGARKVRYGRAA